MKLGAGFVIAGFQRLRPWLQRIVAHFHPLFDTSTPLSARATFALKQCGLFFLAVLLLACLYAVLLIPFTPSIKDLSKAKSEHPSVLISVDGQRLASYRRFNREWVPIEKISPHIVTALTATEDRRFYQHHGIDLYRTAGAILHTLGGKTEGGSTLTQQLARNLYPEEIGRERSITRKIKETITALKIEHAYSKREILETYLNTVPFLYNAVGIEMASRTYFDKPAARLNVLESATLVGMLKGTSYYNPVLNPERAKARRNVVLAQMFKQGVLTPDAYASLKQRPMRLDFERQQEARGAAPHFAEHIRKWLIDWADKNDYNIYQDGLKVYTTIDSRMQAAANQAVQRQMKALQAIADVEWGMRGDHLVSTNADAYAAMHGEIAPFRYFWQSKDGMLDTFIRESSAYRTAVENGENAEAALARLRHDADFIAKLRDEKTRLETGFIAIDPLSGDVKAWVGGRDFNADQYDHVARARRQPGSTFKPFVYGAALENGMSPDTQFVDQVKEFRLRDGSVWRPEDMTPPTGKPMTAAEGLMYSKNTITAQVMQRVGPKKAADFARRAGVRTSPLEPVPSLALGTSPVSLIEMASAFGTIASGGYYRPPLMVTRVEDRNGNVLVQFSTEPDRVVSRTTAEDLTGMMRGVVNAGTGEAIRTRFGIRADVAGKTGTTQNNTDGWFIMMHPQLVAGVWVGFDDARVTMRSNYWGQGAHNALPIAGDFFRHALDRRMVDGGLQFPRARDALPGASLWSPIIDWFNGLRGKRDPYSPPPQTKPAQTGEPLPEHTNDSPGGVIDDARRRIHEIEKSVEDIKKIFR